MLGTIADGFHVGSAQDRHAQRSLTQEYGVADLPADRADTATLVEVLADPDYFADEQTRQELSLSWPMAWCTGLVSSRSMSLLGQRVRLGDHQIFSAVDDAQ